MLKSHPFRAHVSWIRYAAAASAVTVGVAGAGCTALDADGDGGAGADGSGSDGGDLGGGDLGGGDLALDGGLGGQGSQGPDGQTYCQQADVSFVPKTPTVYVLVDRSSSMFEQTDYWGKLKAGVLPVIEDLQADVRFGFGSYTGSSGSCTGLTDSEAPIAENNYDAIETAYNSLGAPSEKGETPTPLAVEQAAAVLAADDAPGDRFILLVTDGNPDFCNDPDPKCGVDALVASLQTAASQGIHTLVFGIDNEFVTPEYFEYFAQAGMGEQPDWTVGLTHDEYSGEVESSCKSFPEWEAFKEANGNDGFLPAGNYSAEGGMASAFLNADPDALAMQIQTTVEGLKSCTFDLGANNVEVKEGSESKGEIFVNEEQIPADQWQMNSTTQLEILGAACDAWQLPEVTEFFAGFPCDALTIK